MNVNNSPETWQADVGGQLYETDFETITQWIREGSLLPQDQVKRGNLRWIEARKVPALIKYFAAAEEGLTLSSTESQTALPPLKAEAAAAGQIYAEPFESPGMQFDKSLAQADLEAPQPSEDFAVSAQILFCSIHPQKTADYSCAICANVFCADCPQNSGGEDRICPFCGASCRRLAA